MGLGSHATGNRGLAQTGRHAIGARSWRPTSSCWRTWARSSSTTATVQTNAGAPSQMSRPTRLILHLNPLQEALQAGGRLAAGTDYRQNRDSLSDGGRAGYRKRGRLGHLRARRPAAGRGRRGSLEVAGAGGTSWSEVEIIDARHDRRVGGEGLRGLGHSDRRERAAGAQAARGVCRSSPAAACATALRWPMRSRWARRRWAGSPFLRAASGSADEVVAIDQFAPELRIAMFAAGAGSVAALREPGRIERVEEILWIWIRRLQPIRRR